MIAAVQTRKLAAAALSLALLAACGGDDDSSADAPTTTADPSAAATAELEAALLTPADLDTGNDLDAGWDVGDVSAGVDIELPDCVVEAEDEAAAASAATKLVTKNDLKLPSLEEYLAQHDDAAGAAAALTAASERLDACQPEFVFQGEPAQGTTARLPLTLGGDQSAAWRTTVTIAGANVAITNIHVVQGDVALAMVHVDLGNPDAALVESYVTKALAKLA